MNSIRIVELIAASAFAAAFVFTGCAKSENTLPFEDEEPMWRPGSARNIPKRPRRNLEYIYWTTKPVTAKSSTRRNT